MRVLKDFASDATWVSASTTRQKLSPTHRLFSPLLVPVLSFPPSVLGLEQKGRAYWKWLGSEAQQHERRFMTRKDGVRYITPVQLFSSLTLRDVLYIPAPHTTLSFSYNLPFKLTPQSLLYPWLVEPPHPYLEMLVASGHFKALWHEADGSQRMIHVGIAWRDKTQRVKSHYRFDYHGQKFLPLLSGNGCLLLHSMLTETNDDRLVKTCWALVFFRVEVRNYSIHVLMQKHELYNSITGKLQPYPESMLSSSWRKVLESCLNSFFLHTDISLPNSFFTL